MGRGQLKWSGLICRATISAGPPVGDMKRMSPRRNSLEAGGAKCRTLKQIHEKLKNLGQVSTPPCIIGLVRMHFSELWRCNGNAERITSFYFSIYLLFYPGKQIPGNKSFLEMLVENGPASLFL